MASSSANNPDGLSDARAWSAAVRETNRLCYELDITNADHIVLWLEHQLDGHAGPLAYIACRILDAHEAAMSPKAGSGDDTGIRDTFRQEFRIASRGHGRAGTAEMRDGPYMSMDDAAGVYADLMLARTASDVGEVFDLDGLKKLWRTGVETGRILQADDVATPPASTSTDSGAAS